VRTAFAETDNSLGAIVRLKEQAVQNDARRATAAETLRIAHNRYEQRLRFIWRSWTPNARCSRRRWALAVEDADTGRFSGPVPRHGRRLD
jgi:hypothetical protein